MDCSWIARDDVFERYVREGLAPDERDAFEEHYFGCDACFEKVRTYRALVTELPSSVVSDPRRPLTRVQRWWWAVAPAVAVLLLVFVAARWFQSGAPAAPKLPPAAVTARGVQAEGPAPQAGIPPPAVSGKPERPTRPPVVALDLLARVEPPVYVPAALRGPHSDDVEKFQAAMARYGDGDYAGALAGLREAASLKPDAAQYKFFLSICLLLTNQVHSAIAGLHETVALGDSPYLEEAHFYLAKAWLRQGDVGAARIELQRTIERRGRLEAAARSLLVQVDALTEGKDRPPGK